MEEWALEVESPLILSLQRCGTFRVEQVGISRLANCHQGVLCAQTHQIRECMLLNTNADDDADDSDADDEDYVYRTENIFFMKIVRTRPSVNYAKDWLKQFFLMPGLVYTCGCYHYGHSRNIFPCIRPFSAW